MTADDKRILYNLIKTASDNVYGYSSPCFQGEPPAFADDVSVQPAAPATPSVQTASGTVQSAEPAAVSADTASPAQPETAQKTEHTSIESVSAKVAECRRCGLCHGRNHPVPGEGVLHPVVLVVGEGPGAEEDATGRPFVGPAGKLLDKMLASISLDLHKNCFIANVVKCRPPQNRTPLPDEAAACRSFLEAQISLLKPAMILAAGRTAAQNLLQTDAGLGQLRGKFYMCGSIPVLVTYHPSALLRNEDLKRPAWEDLKQFRAKLEEAVPGYKDYTDSFFQPLV